MSIKSLCVLIADCQTVHTVKKRRICNSNCICRLFIISVFSIPFYVRIVHIIVMVFTPTYIFTCSKYTLYCPYGIFDGSVKRILVYENRIQLGLSGSKKLFKTLLYTIFLSPVHFSRSKSTLMVSSRNRVRLGGLCLLKVC